MKESFKKLYRGNSNDLRNDILNILNQQSKKIILTANTETFVNVLNNGNINKMLLDDNNLIVCDGIGLALAAKKIINTKIERIPGVEITKELFDIANSKEYIMYIYGSSIKNIKLLKDKIDILYPNIKLAGLKDGYTHNHKDVINEMVKLKPDIIIIALGIPLQEELIYNNFERFDKGIFIGVGGSLDVISGIKKRAPKIFINLNLEWLYRIVKEPRRILKFLKYNMLFLIALKRKKSNF